MSNALQTRPPGVVFPPLQLGDIDEAEQLMRQVTTEEDDVRIELRTFQLGVCAKSPRAVRWTRACRCGGR